MLQSFNYWLTGHGWAEVFFSGELQETRFEFSYLSDPLTELIDSVLELIEHHKDESKVDFFDEPGHYQLRMKIVAIGQVQIEVSVSPENEGVGNTLNEMEFSNLIFKDSDTLIHFCSTIYSGIVDLRNRHSESDYFEKWINYPFPTEKLKLFELAISNMK